jgi:hypothetical protein
MPWLYLLPAAALAAYFAFSGGSSVRLPGKGRLLLIGDSLTGNNTSDLSDGKGTLGGNLAALLRADGYDVTVNALGARSAYSFMAGTTQYNKKTKRGKEPAKGADQLEDAIDDGVDIAVILLGTNDLAGLAKGNTLAATMAPFNKMVAQLRAAGVDVYGIGAPHFPERDDFWSYEPELRDALRDLYGEDHFIDAGPLTKEYRMHAGGKSAANFAARLHSALVGAD